MGMLDDAKETAGEAVEQTRRAVQDGVDRAKDKADEIGADARAKKAEHEAESVHKRNEVKEDLRD